MLKRKLGRILYALMKINAEKIKLNPEQIIPSYNSLEYLIYCIWINLKH